MSKILSGMVEVGPGLEGGTTASLVVVEEEEEVIGEEEEVVVGAGEEGAMAVTMEGEEEEEGEEAKTGGTNPFLEVECFTTILGNQGTQQRYCVCAL